MLEKQQELLFGEPDAEARVPRAGSSEGDLIDQANADAQPRVKFNPRRKRENLRVPVFVQERQTKRILGSRVDESRRGARNRYRQVKGP